jgi:hypothetical protein
MEPNDDLHKEGIDLVGSGVSDENEFSSQTPEEKIEELNNPVQETPTPTPVIQTVPAPTVPQKPQEMPVAARQAFYTPPQVQNSQPKPIPQKPAEKSRDDSSIKPLRTFKSDAEEAVKYGGATKVSMVVAEQKRRETGSTNELYPEKKSSIKLFTIPILFLLILVGSGWYYWKFILSTPTTTNTSSVVINTLLPYTKGSLVVIDSLGNPLETIKKKMKTTNAGLGNIFAVLPVLAATSTQQAPVKDLLAATHIPSRISRSLADNYMVGVYLYDVESPFLILKNTFYQNAFAGMLEWEKDLQNDFSGFITESYPTIDTTFLDRASWGDSVVSNIDVRSLKDASGKIVLAYAFADKDTIVLTTSESGLKYLLDRLLQVRTIQ